MPARVLRTKGSSRTQCGKFVRAIDGVLLVLRCRGFASLLRRTRFLDRDAETFCKHRDGFDKRQPLCLSTNPIASHDSLHLKQCARPFDGPDVEARCFSLWNGQRPFHVLPLRTRRTDSLTRTIMSVRERTSSMMSCLIKSLVAQPVHANSERKARHVLDNWHAATYLARP